MLYRLVSCSGRTLARPALLLSVSVKGAGYLYPCSRLVAAGRRSFLSHCKVPSSCPATRCLSTAASSEDGQLIYTGSLGMAVRGVKMFSFCTSGASLLIMPQILLKTGLGVESFALQVVFCGIIGVFTFLTPVLLYLITKGYVLRLYHNANTDTYTAITSSFFLTERRCVFTQNQVRVPSISKMFANFYVGKRGLLVNPDLFPVPQDYNHLMGYDKPFSFSSDDFE